MLCLYSECSIQGSFCRSWHSGMHKHQCVEAGSSKDHCPPVTQCIMFAKQHVMSFLTRHCSPCTDPHSCNTLLRPWGVATQTAAPCWSQQTAGTQHGAGGTHQMSTQAVHTTCPHKRYAPDMQINGTPQVCRQAVHTRSHNPAISWNNLIMPTR